MAGRLLVSLVVAGAGYAGTIAAGTAPVWGDRIAWVSGAAKVMTCLWNGAGRRVLGGAPRRKCCESPTIQSRLVCEAPEEPSVEALALYGRQLALVDTFILNDGIGSVGTTTEVRIEAVTGGLQRLVALIDVGEGDESWVGPSWFDGDLYFYQDTDGTTDGAVDGFDPARNTYVSASTNHRLRDSCQRSVRVQAVQVAGAYSPRITCACLGGIAGPCAPADPIYKRQKPGISRASVAMELGGLEPPTSWVRSRRSPN